MMETFFMWVLGVIAAGGLALEAYVQWIYR